MEDLLKQISEKHGVSYEIIQQVIKIEKNNVYKKSRRNIFLDLKNVIENAIESEERKDDNK